MKNKPYTVIDLFSGVGGFSIGFIKANANKLFEMKLLVDFDKDAGYTFRKNYPDIPFLCHDVSKLTLKDIKHYSGVFTNPDVVIGGPPCQGFSNAGKRIEEDERNKLVAIYANLSMALAPKVILMENVLNITNSQYFKGLSKSFDKHGYKSQNFVLDAADYGVPQHRKRIFLLALRSRIAKKVGLSAPAICKTDKVIVENAIGDLPPLLAGEGDEYCSYALTTPMSDYQFAMRKGAYGVFNHCARKHSPKFLEKISIISEGGSNRDLAPKLRFSDNYFSQAYARLDRKKIANTITTHFSNPGSGRFTHYRDLRAITVREAARLQSFPDSFIFHGPVVAQAKHVGNAVPPLLSKAWAHHICKILDSCYSKRKKALARMENI
ncbi:MAG: DNA cytosine methyltransferase [Elusimicrobia bacterium]|nr:DNA cytosine methyltransferase [Elusimicrobiota bacterium]